MRPLVNVCGVESESKCESFLYVVSCMQRSAAQLPVKLIEQCTNGRHLC